MATLPPPPPAGPSESGGPRPIAVLHGLVLVLFWTQALWLWPRLPARIPVHFGASGAVDRWAPTTLVTWFALPLLAALISASLWGLGRWAVTAPKLWNVPEKERFLALSPEARAPVMDMVRGFLDGTGIVTILFLGLMHWWTYRTATGASRGLSRLFPLWISLAVLGALVASVALYVRLQRRILEASRSA